MGSSCAVGLIVTATILGPITLVFMAVSFGTDHWLRYEVDRSILTADDKNAIHNRYSHTRYRGIFRECYPGNDTAFLSGDDDVVDGMCYNLKYELPDKSSDKSEKFFVRIHLLRLWLAFYIIALVFFVAAFIFGLIICCWRASRWGYLAGLFAYISAFSLAAAIAFFHGAEYLERNKLSDDGFYNQWPEKIKEATTRDYEWSYALGWVGMILATIAATCYSVAGCFLSAARYEDRDRLEKDRNGAGVGGYPMMLEPRYADDPYAVKPQILYTAEYPHAYQGPYLMADTPTSTINPRYVVAAEPPRPVAVGDTWNIREVA